MTSRILLKVKKNWLCEYIQLKKSMRAVNSKFNFENIEYINIKEKQGFLFKTGYVRLSNINCRFLYDNLLSMKFQKPCYQSFLSNELNVSKESWEKIYRYKILDIIDKNVADFNYRLLNNLLVNNLYLSKWKNINSNCITCTSEIENTKHLIFYCKNVSRIWKLLSLVTGFNITWKHIVIGFYYEDNDKTRMLNNLISFVACRIYKYKMYCRIHKFNEEEYNININLKKTIFTFSSYL